MGKKTFGPIQPCNAAFFFCVCMCVCVCGCVHPQHSTKLTLSYGKLSWSLAPCFSKFSINFVEIHFELRFVEKFCWGLDRCPDGTVNREDRRKQIS